MDVFALFLVFFIFAIISFVRNKSFISPSFLFSSVMSVALMLMLFNYHNWEVKLCSDFIALVLLAFLAFALGSNFTLSKRHNISIDGTVTYKRYPYRVLMLFSVAIFAIYIIVTVSKVGLASSFSGFLNKIYSVQAELTSNNILYNQLGKILVATIYVSFYQFLNMVFEKKHYKMKYYMFIFVPILMGLLYILISTDRNVLIRFFIYITCLWILFYTSRTKHSKNYYNRKLLIYILVLGIVFALVFYAFGKMKQYTSDFGKMISIYAGSGLQDFNLFLQDFNGEYTYGSNTFYSIISLFKTITQDSSIEIINTVEYPGFIAYRAENGYIFASNIYSALQPFYNDFGYFGVISLMFIQGLILGFLYRKCRKKGFSWVVYSAFIYSAAYIPILDQFYARLHLGLLYEIVWLYVIYSFAYRKMKRINAVDFESRKSLEVNVI